MRVLKFKIMYFSIFYLEYIFQYFQYNKKKVLYDFVFAFEKEIAKNCLKMLKNTKFITHIQTNVDLIEQIMC